MENRIDKKTHYKKDNSHLEEEKENPPPSKSLAEVAREANAAGMTYGQYMARKNTAT